MVRGHSSRVRSVGAVPLTQLTHLQYQAVGDQPGRHYTRAELQHALAMEDSEPDQRDISLTHDQQQPSPAPSADVPARLSAARTDSNVSQRALGTPVADRLPSVRKSLTSQPSGLMASPSSGNDAVVATVPSRVNSTTDIARRSSVAFEPPVTSRDADGSTVADAPGAVTTATFACERPRSDALTTWRCLRPCQPECREAQAVALSKLGHNRCHRLV